VNAAPRAPVIAVCGAGIADAGCDALAEEVGRALAAAGAILLCGGHGGVMEAAARGAATAGGTTIGFLPGTSPDDANPWIRIPLATGLGEGRNVLIARAADALVAIGGEWGTLSEVALARKVGTPVVLLRPGLTAHLGLEECATPADAAGRALALARTRRR
jgi:uncharacterized protein (TIGR00725 family)